jgi:DNA-binding NtrC family response regulator
MGEVGEASLPSVLIVDDDEDHCTMLEIALECRGYRVRSAHSCREAMDLLSGGDASVDALVCDLTLGDGTALDVLRGVGVRAPRVSVVLSGFDSQDEQERSLAAGFAAHLVKPTPIETLISVLERGIKRPTSGFRLAKASAAPPPIGASSFKRAMR